MFIVTVPAGFPSPAKDYAEGLLDLNRYLIHLNRYLIHHPAATFFVRVKGDSMTGAGIFCGDLLIVDRALMPAPGNVVIAVVNGDLTVKRFHQEAGQILLMAENPDYAPIVIDPDTDFSIWGVVTRAIHFLGGS